MQTIKNIVPLFFIVFICNLSYAHNSDEINYDVIVNEEMQQLTVHFTPVAAFHLIQELRVELRMERTIKLEDYLADYEAYFNRTFLLKTGDQEATFHLLKSDLTSHDATLTFSMENVNFEVDTFQITVLSFTEVFKKIKNNVNFIINKGSYNCNLNKEKTDCSIKIEVLQKESNFNNVYLGIPIIIAMLLVFRKQKKTSVK